MLIRQEMSKDYNEVYNLVKEAFLNAEHKNSNEHNLVASLRESDAFIPQLSLVAEIDNKIVGHILFTKAKVNNDTVLVLAPLSVLPEFQRRGIGTALIKKGHKIAKELGFQYSIVVGSAEYYQRHGYLPAKQFGIEVPDNIPCENFMAIKLLDYAKPISGSVASAKEFGI